MTQWQDTHSCSPKMHVKPLRFYPPSRRAYRPWPSHQKHRCFFSLRWQRRLKHMEEKSSISGKNSLVCRKIHMYLHVMIATSGNLNGIILLTLKRRWVWTASKYYSCQQQKCTMNRQEVPFAAFLVHVKAIGISELSSLLKGMHRMHLGLSVYIYYFHRLPCFQVLFSKSDFPCKI